MKFKLRIQADMWLASLDDFFDFEMKGPAMEGGFCDLQELQRAHLDLSQSENEQD